MKMNSCTRSAICSALIAVSAAMAGQNPEPAENAVPDERISAAVRQYRLLAVRAASRLGRSSPEFGKWGDAAFYFAGWINATNAVSQLLEDLELPSSDARAVAWRAKVDAWRDAKRAGNGSAPRPVADDRVGKFRFPPTPAAGALAMMPIPVHEFTNMILEAGAGTRRAELLAWAAAARHGEAFDKTVGDAAETTDPLWIWVRGFREDYRPWTWQVPAERYAGMFPPRDKELFERTVSELERIAADAARTGDAGVISRCGEALSEMGRSLE